MKTKVLFSYIALLSIFAILSAGLLPAYSLKTPEEPLINDSQTKFESYGQLALNFEPNQGQADERVKFLSHGGGYSLFLTSTEAILSLSQPTSKTKIADPKLFNNTTGENQSIEMVSFHMQLLGTQSTSSLIGVDELPGKVNYFVGNDPLLWQTDIPTYGKVKYQEVYPGVDLVFYGNQTNLEYDFIVAPGADPTNITLGFKGIDNLKRDRKGNLVFSLSGGQIQMQKPFIYQEINGARQTIRGGYAISKNQQVKFEIEAYDSSKPLMIDPILLYSSYFGGFSDDDGMGIALDSSGNIFVVGPTTSTSFSMTNPFQPTYGGGAFDGFVAKLNPAGSAVIYSTYFGGSDEDTATNIAIDNSGNAYITGYTRSTDFPTQNPLQPANGGGSDAYVAKLSADGATLVYSTYVGGNADDPSVDIVLDFANNAVISGQTQSTNFPTANPIQANKGGDADAFVAKLNAAGSAFIYSTYFGGSSNDSGDGIALDTNGNAFLMGTTLSTNLPTKNPLQAANASPGSHDAFLAKMNPSGSLIFSTYLGGNNEDSGNDVAVDSAGNAYVTGHTLSSNFPVLNPVQSTLHGSNDAFVTKINSTGSALIYSTYLGGNNYENGRDIAVDKDGSAYVTGETTSANFPVVDPIQSTFGGGAEPGDAFVAKLNPTGKPLDYSTYLGGSGSDRGRRIIVAFGVAYVTGLTQSDDFPLQDPIQSEFRGDSDAFIVKICAPRYTVTSAADSGPGTLRQAIADVCPGGTIDFNLTYPATITITSYLLLGKDMTIAGPGASNLMVSGNGTTSIFYNDYSNPRNISISDLTIADAYSVISAGGGIYNFGALTVSDVVFNNNQNGTGSGIYNGGSGILTVTNSAFTDNHAIGGYAMGGAISNEGSATIINSTFSGNTAPFGAGGISNSGVLTITNSTFSNNSTQYNGGGINNYSTGNITIEYSIFSDNIAYAGAGIDNSGTLSVSNTTFNNNVASYIGGGIDAGGLTTISNSTFINNHTTLDNSWGGGIAYWGNSGNLTISNSAFVGNTAVLGGGAYIGRTATIINSTFSGNNATQFGDGIYNDGTSILNISNTILANGLGGNDCYNNGANIGTNTNNLIENNAASPNNCGVPALTGDPKLGALTGTPAYFPLLSGSPAIDAGNDAICAAAPVSNTSQNGRTRPQGTHCDIGSYEADATLTLRSSGAQDGWVLESTETSSVGGAKDNAAATFILGDGAADKQYRAILSFNTSSLPDNAVITKATLKIRKQGQVGTNPFTLLGGLKVDMKKPYFGADPGLAIGDFQAAAGKVSVATFGATPVLNWYSAVLNLTGRNYINKLGTTQFRLRFFTDDNNDNGADYLKFFSGDSATVSAKPMLIIEYYVP